MGHQRTFCRVLLDHLVRAEYEEARARITIPALYIVGTVEPFGPAVDEHRARAANMGPNAEFTVIESPDPQDLTKAFALEADAQVDFLRRVL